MVANDREERAYFRRLVCEDEAPIEAMLIELPDVNPYAFDELDDESEDIPF